MDVGMTDPSSEAGDVLGLEGKRALVTGGSRGVGRATALLLGKLGVRVGISFRSREEEAREVVEALGELGTEGWAEPADLTREEDARRLFQRVDRELGGLDLFVGNHGIWPPDEVPVAEMTTERWRRTLEVNLHGTFLACREAISRLADGGRIVLVSSTAAQRGEAFHSDYAASKGAFHSLAKGLCVELAPRDVTVNVVAPGWIDTEMSASAFEGEGRRRIEEAIPLGRIATAEDVAGPIVFLCSRLARHVTGEVVNVNGGAVVPG